MSGSPAAGERAALRGYRSQYDHIAARVYDTLISGDFVQLRLTDPEAGRVDDLVLVLRDGAHGYQFKTSEDPAALTLGRLLAARRTRGGGPAPSLLRSLAQGWLSLAGRFASAHVHLVTDEPPSTSDRLIDGGFSGSRHFSAFLSTALSPVRAGALELGQAEQVWAAPFERMRAESGLSDGDFSRFAGALHLELGVRSPLDGHSDLRRGDLIALSDALFRLVSDAASVVELNREQVLALVGWTDRPRLRSRHEFPVDADTYTPLVDAIAELDERLSGTSAGYLAVVGPPGAGKSTLLSQALSGRDDRIVRYYAYVPGSAGARTRMSAHGFLHDLVLLLRSAGLQHAREELVSGDVVGLRRQLDEQFDAAAAQYRAGGPRTIVVVDGLDHVERDHPTAGLLEELPEPGSLPEGVVILLGTRNLGPVPSKAKAQILERGGAVDLREHRLSTSAVMQLCRRSAVTASLGQEAHERVAEVSGGYPLAVAYLLNRLRDAPEAEPLAVIDSAPAYAGDVAQDYRAAWDAIGQEAGLIRLLAVVSRLRVGFTTAWLQSWNTPETLHVWRTTVQFLFRRTDDGWRFFHDSFRQFAADRTAEGDLGAADPGADAGWHAAAAGLCEASAEPKMQWEALHLRSASGQHDDVLRLAQQDEFRRQFRALRSPELIRDDIDDALRIAADRADTTTMLRLLLAKVELTQRGQALDDVDVPRALLAAGLGQEAVAYAGDQGRRVPLAHAYGLAAALGEAGDPAGRRLFDAVEHEGLEDTRTTPVSGREKDAAVAWARAAVRYRPLDTVLATIARWGRARSDDDLQRERRGQTAQAMRLAVIAALTEARDTAGLTALWELLLSKAPPIEPPADPGAGEPAPGQQPSDQDDEQADTGEALVALYGALASSAPPEHVPVLADRLAGAVLGRAMYRTAALAAAELLAQAGDYASASRLVERLGFERALTAGSLSYRDNDAGIDVRIRYWSLRHALADRDGQAVPPSQPPDAATPAGDGIDPGAFVHTDTASIELAARIDAAVRALALIDSAIAMGRPPPLHEAWSSLVPILALAKGPAGRSSSTNHQIRQHRLPLLLAALRVAERHGPGLLRHAADHVALLIDAEPDNWPPYIRMPIAGRLRTAGFAVPWYASTLEEMTQEAESQDVHSRLESLAELVRVHAADGNANAARELALRLVDAAFGVGYRKDYQFDEWVGWLGRALAGDGGHRWLDDAAWLARLLVEADERSEGAPGRAAAFLPAAVAAVLPMHAVRLFEFLVAHGTVSHTRALGELVAALLPDVDDTDGLRMTGDLIIGVLAPASVDARPETAEAFTAACRRLLPPAQADAAIVELREKVQRVALGSSRPAWNEALGLPADPPPAPPSGSSSEYGSLKTADGRTIAEDDVAASARTVREIRDLRLSESRGSTFRWHKVLRRQDLTSADTAELTALFDDGTARGGQALAAIAERTQAAGRPEQAVAVARRALAASDGRGWAAGWDGGGRRTAAAVLARSGGHAGRVDAARDLAAEAEQADWLAAMLLGELSDVVAALDPASDPQTTWPEIRAYLDGMASSIGLTADDPLEVRPPMWWRKAPATGQAQPAAGTATQALAELSARHLAHPAWVVRDGALRASAGALATRTAGAADAVFRLASAPDCPEDVLEAAGRAVLLARQNGLAGPTASLLDELLRDHPSRILRDLATAPHRTSRPLPLVYRLAVPAHAEGGLAAPEPLLQPHLGQYAVLARLAGVDPDTVRAVAGRRAADLLRSAPSVKEVQEALQGAEMLLAHPVPEVSASRGAFGRVLSDFDDAGTLAGAPPHVRSWFRTVDLRLLDASPSERPAAVPGPPPAGHDQRMDRWTDELPARLQDHVDALRRSDRGDWRLLAGTSRLHVLNWEDLEERATWGTVPGPAADDVGLGRVRGWTVDDLAQPDPDGLPPAGDPLAVANDGWTLNHWAGEWVGLRPAVAAALGWTPDPASPGRWLTPAGAPAVERLWWTDGSWGRYSKAFDDTAAEGWAVMATGAATDQLVAAFGSLTTTVVLERSGRHGASSMSVRTVLDQRWT